MVRETNKPVPDSLMVVLVLNAAEQPWLSPPDQLVPAQFGDVMAVTRLVVTVPVAPLDDVTFDTDLPRPETENEIADEL